MLYFITQKTCLANKCLTLGKRLSDKVPLGNMRMRQSEPLGLKLKVVKEKQVKVDDTVGIAFALPAFSRTPHPSLNLLRHVEKGQWLKRGANHGHRIGEAMLTAEPPRLALDVGGSIKHLACLLLQQGNRLIQVLRAFAQVAAQSDIYDMLVHQSGIISMASP